MKTRRNFLKAGMLAGLATNLPFDSFGKAMSKPQEDGVKHWVWIRPNPAEKDDELKKRYENYHRAGIRGIFFEADSEKHFRAAKSANLEAHRWMWTMNRGEKTLLEAHPEWYAISRDGKSCADNPPYVDYYRWLCPSKPEVQEYLQNEVRKIVEKDYIDGIHLDYVRFCDVILPVNLWDNYKIEQTSELPEYDFCYCETCKEKFKEWRGEDIMAIKYPQESLSWRLFRYNAITKVVNKLSTVAKEAGKPITAAVFPTPEVAKRIVRQDWPNWPLNAVCPMIYHGFYKESVSWIGDAVAEGVNALHGRFPLYAGLYLPDFKNKNELSGGIIYALKNGAKGVSLFGDISDETLATLKDASLLAQK